MARRGADSVFLRKDRPRGTKRWVAQLHLGADPTTGRPRYKTSYHLTQAEAEEALSKQQEGRRRNQIRPGSAPTVKAYLERWVEDIETRVEAKTHADYARWVENRLVPALGTVRLDKVTKAQAQGLLDKLARDGLAPKSVANLRGVARKAWNDAVDLELVSVNPWERLKLPKVGKRAFPVWTPDQIRGFFAAVGNDSDRNLFILAVFSGARAGELLALRRSDVDLARGTISIGASVSRQGGGKRGIVVKAPKTESSWRTISIHPLGMGALRAQMETVDRWKVDTDLLFPTKTGQPRYVERPRNKLREICEALEYPVLRFHDLRHQHAALLIALGVHAKTIQERLGHSSIQITMDRYGHLMAGVDQDASDRLGKMLE